MIIDTKENYGINVFNNFINPSKGFQFNRTMANMTKYKNMVLISIIGADLLCTAMVRQVLNKKYGIAAAIIFLVVGFVISYGIGLKYPNIQRFLTYAAATSVFVICIINIKTSDYSIIANFLNSSVMISILLTTHISSFMISTLIYATGFLTYCVLFLVKFHTSMNIIRRASIFSSIIHSVQFGI